MQLDSNVISRANKMKLIMQYGVGLEGICLSVLIDQLVYLIGDGLI